MILFGWIMIVEINVIISKLKIFLKENLRQEKYRADIFKEIFLLIFKNIKSI